MLYQYKYKFYLNARHYVVLNGEKGLPHSHCFEIIVEIIKLGDSDTKFSEVERTIDRILAPFQHKLLNEKFPFDRISPTLENLAVFFKNSINYKIQRLGWGILALEMSETPSRSFVLTFDVDSVYFEKGKFMNLDEFDYDFPEDPEEQYEDLDEEE